MSTIHSGRLSPAEAEERGIPEDIYINPDNLPEPPDIIEQEDYQDVAPTRATIETKKSHRMKALFKKDKSKKKSKGASQLADVMGKTSTPSHTSTISSRGDPADNIPVLYPTSTDPDKSSRMESFREFFKKKPQEYDESKYGTDSKFGATSTQQHTADSMRVTMRNFFYGPQAHSPPTSPNTCDVIAPLNAPLPKSPCRMSIVLFIIFGSMVIIGIALTIAGYTNTNNAKTAEHCMVLGPIFLLLGCFLITGQVFFMLFWLDDPLPCMKDCMEKVDSAIGGVKDPYGLKKAETYQPQRTSYHPGLRLSTFMTPTSITITENIPMQPMYTGTYDPDPPGPVGPAAFDSYPPQYKRNASQDSQNSSYQNSSYQDDSFTAGRLL